MRVDYKIDCWAVFLYFQQSTIFVGSHNDFSSLPKKCRMDFTKYNSSSTFSFEMKQHIINYSYEFLPQQFLMTF